MKKLIAKILLAIILASAPLLSARAASDSRFFKKAAERVWSTRNELFDPNTEVPDSIKEGVSALVLADYNCIDTDFDYYDFKTKRVYWNRRMVKLFDSKAVEDFTEFEFGQRERLNAEFFTFGGSDNAFGARIHKPDGQIIDVDLSQAVEINDGKKNRKKDVSSRKIAIPGLEPGDILEYFDYTEEWMKHYDLPAIDFVPVDKYPVVAYMIEGTFDPKVTVEFRTYNGLPSPERGKTDKGENGLFLTLSYVGVVKDRECLRRYRQIPFLRINTLNNNSEHRFYPMTKRSGGLYEHVSTGTIYRDIKYVLAASSYDLPLPGEIPAEFQGEKGGAFMGPREKFTNFTEPSIFSTPKSRAAQNKLTTNARIEIDPENNTAEGTAEFMIVGANKNIAGDITDFREWAMTVEDFLGIPDNKRYKDNKYDEVERNKELNEDAQAIAQELLGKSIIGAKDMEVTQRGVVPGAPELKFNMKIKAERCVSDAGNDLLLNVGSFSGNNHRYEGDDRQRQLDAFQVSPRQYSYSVTFAIPDGYEVDAASLEALKVNVNNKYGAYFASAKMEENGDVTVNVLERYNAYIIPAEHWDSYLQISDAAAAFNDAALLLKKK